jgi:ABC-2 type transport system ATP-binding protein
MSNALELDRIIKRFGDFTAVDGVSLIVPAGSIYGFLGPNGAGKTTTIRMIMNILRPDEGSIQILGGPSGEGVKTRTGYLPEERGVYKKMKVLDLVAYFGTLKGLSRGEAARRGKRHLEDMGLGDWIGRNCQDLSKGMQQKVQFIATIVHGPELLILDEPFSGLDPINTEVLKDKILELKAAGTTVLFSTHIMDQAEKLCDSVVLINSGKKVLDGTLDEVRRSAVAEETVVIEFEGPFVSLEELPMVDRVSDFGRSLEVFIKPGHEPEKLLEALVGKVKLRRFEVRRPSLHEIFLRAVGGESSEPVAAEAGVRS